MWFVRSLPVIALLLVTHGTLHADVPEVLPLGVTGSGRANENSPAVYRLSVSGPGVLTVAVRAADGRDVAVDVADADGQTLVDGSADRDAHGDLGAEQLATTLGSAGEYRVYVSVYEGSARFVIGAAFLAMPEAALPQDPNGGPGTAITLQTGGQTGGTIRPTRGDNRDWYVVTPTGNGVLTVYTRSADDLILEAFDPLDYRTPIAAADNDDQNAMGNESLTLDVNRDKPVYFRVSTYDEAADYVISAGMVGTRRVPAE